MRTPSDLTIDERGDLLFHFFSREGVRSVAPFYGLETTACLRQVMSDVRIVNHFLDRNLHGSKLYLGSNVYSLDFGREWQSDGKVIRVTRIFAKNNPVYRTSNYRTPTGGTKSLHDIYNENVLEKKHHNILASWYLPSNASKYIFKPLSWAAHVTGFAPDVLEVDTKLYARAVRGLFAGRVLLMVLIKQGDVGKLKEIEGFHAYQDGKIKSSIHGRSVAILDGLRIHYNFCARKDKLGKMTPMEHAGLPRLDENNTWRPLLKHAIEYCKIHPVPLTCPWDRTQTDPLSIRDTLLPVVKERSQARKIITPSIIDANRNPYVDIQTIVKIHALKNNKFSVREISRELQIPRSTVFYYIH